MTIMEPLAEHRARPRVGNEEAGSAVADAPVDHAHLARYTMGNRSLELEVLQLFAEQAPITLQQLRAATSTKDWHVAAHTLKGSARAVGARAVAKAAEIAEAAGHADAQRAEIVAAIETKVDEVRGYISKLPSA
jgi:HPt (histidine-containing phosphotransfer) domain-containing protein